MLESDGMGSSVPAAGVTSVSFTTGGAVVRVEFGAAVGDDRLELVWRCLHYR